MQSLPIARLAAAAALAAAPSLAVAGGLDAPLIDLAPIGAAPAVPLSFAGAYAGGSLGAAQLDGDDAAGLLEPAFDDFFGEEGSEQFVEDTFDLDDRALAYGVHAGYNVQRGSVVFGPELAIFGGEVELGGVSEFDDGDVEESVDVEVNFGARLALRGGVARGRTLFYGTLGVAYLDLDVATDGVFLDATSNDRDDVGYAAGFGFERLITDRMSAGAQYTLHAFDHFDLADGDGGEADVRHRTLEARVSFQF